MPNKWTDENAHDDAYDKLHMGKPLVFWWEWVFLLALILLGISMLARAAFADPPANVTGQFHAYYESLYDHEGGHCCGKADCRPTRYKEVQDQTGTHYVAWLARLNRWVDVPDGKVIHYANPTGHGTLCTFDRATYPDSQLPDGYVYCFNPWGDGG